MTAPDTTCFKIASGVNTTLRGPLLTGLLITFPVHLHDAVIVVVQGLPQHGGKGGKGTGRNSLGEYPVPGEGVVRGHPDFLLPRSCSFNEPPAFSLLSIFFHNESSFVSVSLHNDDTIKDSYTMYHLHCQYDTA